ncbi:hypothetical protein HY440_02805 [Candidatus Microgenomates bacterium]|nr:hypothetical protein [Candidatus Microgenomates bacterium]
MAKTLAIIAVGVLLQLFAVWFLGASRDGGLFFCCRGVPDDIYHLALTHQLVTQFPPEEPGMVGTVVKNYHYLSSLAMADFIRVFHLPLTATVYQYFPLLVSILLGLTTVVTAQLLQLSNKITRLWLFFLYFHGDILYLLLFLRGKGLNFDVTIFDDATKLLAGPPRSFSILLLFTGLVMLLLWIRKRSWLTGVLTAVVLGSLMGFKVYTGIFALVGLAALGLYSKRLLVPALALIVSLAIYLPVNGASGGLAWNGFYRFDDFVAQPAFGLANLELARLAGAGYLVIIFAALYFVFLYGATILAFFQSRKTLSLLPKELVIFLLSAIAITGFVGTFFVQSVGGLNTVQFLISLYFVGALFAALTVSRFPKLAIALVILLTLPRPFYEAWGNIQMIKNGQGFFVSAGQLEALNFLKNNTPTTSVVALPPDLARQEVSLYVRFLADRPLYVAGYTGVLQDHQVAGAKERLDKPDLGKIDYLYVPKQYSFPSSGQKVFENQDVSVFQIPKI